MLECVYDKFVDGRPWVASTTFAVVAPRRSQLSLEPWRAGSNWNWCGEGVLRHFFVSSLRFGPVRCWAAERIVGADGGHLVQAEGRLSGQQQVV